MLKFNIYHLVTIPRNELGVENTDCLCFWLFYYKQKMLLCDFFSLVLHIWKLVKTLLGFKSKQKKCCKNLNM